MMKELAFIFGAALGGAVVYVIAGLLPSQYGGVFLLVVPLIVGAVGGKGSSRAAVGGGLAAVLALLAATMGSTLLRQEPGDEDPGDTAMGNRDMFGFALLTIFTGLVGALGGAALHKDTEPSGMAKSNQSDDSLHSS